MKILTQDEVFINDSEINYAYHKSLKDFMGIHGHDFYEMFLIISGEVIHNLNGKGSLLTTGTLVIIRCDDVHYYERSGSSECEYINIAFSKETFKKYANLIGTPNHVNTLLHTENYQITVDNRFLEQIKNKCESISSYQAINYRVISLLFDIIAYLIENMETEPLNNVPLEIRKLCNELQNPDNFEKGLKEIFGQYNRSYEHYCRNFNKYIGVTPTAFYNDVKMNYARNLLLFTNNTIIDICFSCGFENMGYFYELFTKKYAATPAKFRAQHKRDLI